MILALTDMLKGLINLAMRDSQELQETAHMKSYGVDASPKYPKCIFQYENGSSLLIKCCLQKSLRGPKANLMDP